MTLHALNFYMSAGQFELGFVMVEENVLPGRRRMTALALSAEDAFVLILIQVAAHAGRGRGFEIIRAMALFAGHRTVLPFERKSGPGVVEADLRPGFRIMAAIAGFSQRSLVLVVFNVAGITVPGSVAVFWLEMTQAAFYGLVFAVELKIGFFVIEAVGIEHNQTGFTPFMFGMTGLAMSRLDFPVKTGLLLDVLFDLLVACQAFIIENLLNKTVAVQTLPFGLLVSLRNFTGHHAFQHVKGFGDPQGGEDDNQNNQAGSFPHQASLRFQGYSKKSTRPRRERSR